MLRRADRRVSGQLGFLGWTHPIAVLVNGRIVLAHLAAVADPARLLLPEDARCHFCTEVHYSARPEFDKYPLVFLCIVIHSDSLLSKQNVHKPESPATSSYHTRFLG